MFDYGILQDAGKVSAEIAKLHAETEFEKYRVIQDRLFMPDFDKYMLELEKKHKEIRIGYQVETVKSGSSTPCECMANSCSERMNV